MEKRESFQNAVGRDTRDAIAVVGIGCRFPGGVNNPEQFWELLRSGQDAIIEVPPERWSLDDYYDPERGRKGKMVTRFGGFIDGMDQFDPEFFGISPNEAERMDPQQRQLLEVTWEALEDGGHVPAKLRGTDVGVFIGAFALDYHALQFGDPFQRSVSTYSAASSMATMLSNRISYIYDFRGPSMTIDTACSSSLVSLHLACESLRSGESAMALAGGIVLTFAPQYTVVESAGGFLSPEGRCKTFDASASGYVRGEGVGVVALKRLSDAVEAGDPIQAVILASGVNQDGHTVGITVPSGNAQARLIRDTIRKAGVKPTDIRYVEAHGTGTPVGDPIEAGAIGEVYGQGRLASEPLLIGSCKTNIGHTESAAGIAGFIKAVLCLRHRQIPPHLHLQQPNPAIAFDSWRLKVPTALEPWPEHEGPAIAAVNSFGFGGANAHAIVREPLQNEMAPTGEADAAMRETARSDSETAGAPPGRRTAKAGPETAAADNSQGQVYVLPLSARKSEALAQARAAYLRLTGSGDLQPHALEDLCWSAGVRREHHSYRQAFVFRTREELAAQLNGSGPTSDAERGKRVFFGRKPSGEKPKLVWTFSGMGPQWYGMGRQLLQREPVFRAIMERGDALFTPVAGWSMLEELLKDEAHSRMNETGISMPLSFLLQVSLAALWRSWGIVPDMIIGHSAGEVAAFHEAGVYTLEDALRVVYHRSRLLDRMGGTGGMAFVAVSGTEAAELLAGLEDKVGIGAVNSPSSVTLSGDEEALAEIVRRAEEKKLFTRMLRVQAPFHSRYMDPVKEELINSLNRVESRTVSIPLYSSVTAGEVRGEEIDGSYWWRNVRETVAYASAIDRLIQQGFTNFLEIGAHPVLAGPLAECLGDKPGLVVASIRRKEDESEAMMRGLAELYTAGFEPDWQAVCRQGRWTKLPAYAWQKKRYWHEPEFIRHIRHGHKDHPLLGRPLPGAAKAWESEITLRRLPYLRDHRVLDQVLYPAAAYIEGAMATIAQTLSLAEGSCVLEQLELHRGLTLPPSQPSAVIQHVLDAENGTFRIFSAQDEQRSAFVLNASGRLRQVQHHPGEAAVDITAARQATPMVIDQAKAYRILKNTGFDYGPAFQGIQQVHLGEDEAWVEIELPLEDAVTREYGFHPSLMDACFQALLAAEFPVEGEQPRDFGHEFRIPVGIGSIRFYERPGGRLWAHSRMSERNGTLTRGNLRVYNEQGKLVAEFLDFVKRSVGAATSRMDGLQARRWLNRLEWREAELPVANPDTAVALGRRAPGTWLILADARGIAEEAAALLRREGNNCLLVAAGDGYAFGGEARASRIDPKVSAHYDRLLADAVQVTGGALSGVVHIWNADLPAMEELAGRQLGGQWDRIKSIGTHSLLYLAQSLARTGADTGVWIVTQGAQSIPGEERPVAVFQAGAWGLGRYIGQQEMSQYGKGLIDMDPRASAAYTAQSLVNEMTAGDAENQIAYRENRRYVLRLKRDSETPSSLPMRCRADGAYLVTGAFGAIGQEVARLLVHKGARHLLLLGRTSLPERTRWDRIAADSREGERIAFVRELEAAGAHISVVGVDMTDEAAMSGFIQQYEAGGSLPIRGVVHSAGTVKDVLLTQMDGRIFDEAYDPKAMGAWLLHQAMLEQPLEFFVLFSSLGSLLPAAGQGNYAAGNACLDALAAYRRSLGLPALSINWGPWSVGMVEKLQLTDIFETNGIDIITPAVGMRLFEHLLGQNVTQIVALSAGWRAFRKLYDYIPLLELLEEDDSGCAGVSESGELAIEAIKMLAPHERELAVRQHLEIIIADLLHFAADEVDTTKALPEIGLDSMMAIRLRARLLNEFGVAPMIGELLSGNSISSLSGKLVRQFVEQHQLAREYSSVG